KSRSGAENFVGAAELTVLALQGLESLTLVGGEPRPLPAVDLRGPHPVAQGLCGHPALRRDRGDRRPLRGVVALVLAHEPHRPLPDFCWVPASVCHRSILSRIGASNIPGAIHYFSWVPPFGYRSILEDPITNGKQFFLP